MLAILGWRAGVVMVECGLHWTSGHPAHNAQFGLRPHAAYTSLHHPYTGIQVSHNHKGLFPYYVISYNKQGSFQMITKDYSNGPRVVRKDYILWKIQNMQESASMPASSSQLR